MHNNSVHNSNAVQCASTRNTDLLVLYMEKITVLTLGDGNYILARVQAVHV
jgi:hypothetical protein